MANPPDAFLSYARVDDDHYKRALSRFRSGLAGAVHLVTGERFEIFQDVEAMVTGPPWAEQLTKALAAVWFFIPILTPAYFRSNNCRAELKKFLQEEEKTKRKDRILPIYWVDCEVIEEDELRDADPLAKRLLERQWCDWRNLRNSDSKKTRKPLEKLAQAIGQARRRARSTDHRPPFRGQISADDVLSFVEEGWKSRDLTAELETTPAVDHRHRANRLTDLYTFLRRTYYDMPVLMGPEGAFPVAVLPLSARAVSDLDHLSIALGREPDPFAVFNEDLIPALKKRGVKIWNGRTFSLSKIILDSNGCVDGLEGYLGYYFNMVKSADYLELELLAAGLRLGDKISLNALPARTEALARYPSPGECLRSGGGVDAAIAISTLVVFLWKGEYWMLCDVRSKSVAEYSDLYHVVPSFIYQPVTAPNEHNLAIEKSVIHNIYREYLEELFAMEEIEHSGSPVAPDFFYGYSNLHLLKNLLGRDAAKLVGTSLIFNLLTHRPEICSVLVIDDESWYGRQAAGEADPPLRYLRLIPEFLQNEEQTEEPHLELVTMLPLRHPRWADVAKPWRMVPPGAPALILGTKLACKLIGIEEPDWVRPFRVEPPLRSSPPIL
jgi:hypothetical protein